MAEGSGGLADLDLLEALAGWTTPQDEALGTTPSALNVSELPGSGQEGAGPGGLAMPAPDPVLYAIQLWFTPLLVSLGTLGNCLCVFVFFGTKLKKLSSR